MSRTVSTPCPAAAFPLHAEPVLPLDREPIRTRLDFTQLKEENPMTKEEFVAHCIRHHESFPNVGEIDLATAQAVLDSLAPSAALPRMTAEEFRSAWNLFVTDPKVMDPDR